jgi:nucleotide-binding universal stress UspA family protein
MKILLATDLSDEGPSASEELAAAIARRWGQGIVLLHVYEPPNRLVAQAAGDLAAFERSLAQQSQADLELQASRVRARGVGVEARFEQGEAPRVIAEVAHAIGAGLISMGSHRRRGLERLLLGSVAHRTLLAADRPVLVARGVEPPPAFREWAAGRRPLRVTLAVDGSPASGAAAEWVGRLGQAGDVQVRLVHVFSPFLEAVRLGLQQRAESSPAEIEALLEGELRAFLGPFLDVRTMPFIGRASTLSAGEALATEADPSATDLLVVGTSQRRGLRRLWLGSTAELAVRRARVPVVCVPAVSSRALDETVRQELGLDDADEIC